MEKNKKQNKRKPYKKEKRYFKFDKYFIALLILLILLIINLCILGNYKYQERKAKEKQRQKQIQLEQKVIKKVEKKQIEYGDIIFLGDSITEWYDLEKYYDIPIVNSGVATWTTDDILNHLDEKIFQYNAKKIIILIGTNDLDRKKTPEEVVKNIEKIVSNIKEVNKETEIYIESIYPINNTDNQKIDHGIVNERTNDIIIETNRQLKKYCKQEKITYINMYDLLTDEEGNLKLEYTKEGLHISDEGYQIITKKILEYI